MSDRDWQIFLGPGTHLCVPYIPGGIFSGPFAASNSSPLYGISMAAVPFGHAYRITELNTIETRLLSYLEMSILNDKGI